MHHISLFTCLLVCMAGVARAQALFESDVLKTSAGEVTMTFIGHGSLWFAFLPMNLPYTMTSAMVADAVRAFQPKVLYPYHFGETDTSKLTTLLKDLPGMEVRMRKMK